MLPSNYLKLSPSERKQARLQHTKDEQNRCKDEYGISKCKHCGRTANETVFLNNDTCIDCACEDGNLRDIDWDDTPGFRH